VLTRSASLIAYESDALPGYRQRPALAVFPGTRDEVIAAVKVLAAHRAPFVARGAGTGLSGGALAGDVTLLGLQRLKRIVEIDPEARTAVVEPGVVNATLTTAVAKYGLHYAPDPSSQTACTIGGNVAENAGGPHCLKYGVTLNHVVAATVVLPDGSVTTLHAPEHADAGPDLLGAFIGSEGCFGIALDVTVRLTPNPQAVRTLLADFMTVEAAARCTTAIIAAGIIPAACELMDRPTIRAVEASIYAAGYPTDAAAVLLVEVDGSAPSVPADAAIIERICREHGARQVRVAVDAVDRARLWQGRKKAFGAMGRVAPHLVVQDAVVPRTQLANVLQQIGEIGERHRLTVCNVFHAGDGNLHPNIPYNANDPDESARVHEAMTEIMSLCIAAGGTISGEHGVGLDKLGYMEALFTDDTLDAMCRLRGAFDPDRRANPGKVVPIHSCREWHGVARTGAAPLPVPPRARPQTTPDLSRTVIEYIPSDLTITVRADITLAELDSVTCVNDQWCPLLPWGDDRITVGAVLARGLRGPTSPTLGAPRDLTLGVALTDRRSAHIVAGGRVVKNVAGFDLTRLMIGSGEVLGSISSATLRLRAIPAVRRVRAIAAATADHAAWRTFCRGPLAPMGAETIPSAVAAALGLPAEPHLVCWVGGNEPHIDATLAALDGVGPVHDLPELAWQTVRAHGPYHPPRVVPDNDVRTALRDRIVAAFTPVPAPRSTHG
jgi:glycolate oxidase subunit GlcD